MGHLEHLPEVILPVAVDWSAKLFLAILIMLVGWGLSRFAYRGIRQALLHMRFLDPTLKPLIASLARYGILILAATAALQRIGVETASLIALVGAAGLAVGLAMQGALSNVASGVMLLILRPFQIGDFIEFSSTTGTVAEIGLFTTTLTSPDRVYISVPNATIFGATIINYSREPMRRINFTVGIDYGDDIDRAQNIVLDILKAEERVLSHPAPEAPVGALSESSVDIYVRGWVRTDQYWDVVFLLQKKVKQAFDRNGISIPFPQRVVTVRSAGNGTTEVHAAGAAD
ncbi:MAG: mechanosensitive ion channel [Proteobacteria bacterium]|nr:mechanosensitive ion channel [Pseudomonadota bacterium]